MPTPSARRACALALAALVATGALAGCARSDKAAAPPPKPTPIADLNTASMDVPRLEFCKLVPSSAVKRALGGSVASASAYGNGDSDPASGVAGQVLHELGCVWTGKDGTTARAWVFARPADTTLAQSVVAATGRQPGCQAVPGPAFGSPTVTQQCTLAGGVARVRHAGLFDQTWLSCELSGAPGTPPQQVGPRADAWCVEVAESLNTSR